MVEREFHESGSNRLMSADSVFYTHKTLDVDVYDEIRSYLDEHGCRTRRELSEELGIPFSTLFYYLEDMILDQALVTCKVARKGRQGRARVYYDIADR
jgi:predicted ArsR family transcriptional regulator